LSRGDWSEREEHFSHAGVNRDNISVPHFDMNIDSAQEAAVTVEDQLLIPDRVESLEDVFSAETRNTRSCYGSVVRIYQPHDAIGVRGLVQIHGQQLKGVDERNPNRRERGRRWA
jgi:hypothetical protein